MIFPDPSKAPQESKLAKTYTKIDKFWVLELNKITGWFEKNSFGPKKLNRDHLKIVRAKNFVLNSSVFEFCKIYTKIDKFLDFRPSEGH